MDASNIQRKLSDRKQDADGLLSTLEGQRRKLASTHAQEISDLQEATTRLCHIFARQDQSGFAGKVLPSFKKVHAEAVRLISEDAARQKVLASDLVPQAISAVDALQVRHAKSQDNLSACQDQYDQALDSAQDKIIQSDAEAAHLSASLEAGHERAERLDSILEQMKSQYQDLEKRLQQDPVFAYFDDGAGRGNGFERAVDRVLARWCNFPAQHRVREAAADQVRMWENYSSQLEQQMQQINTRLDEILSRALEDQAVVSCAGNLADAKAEFSRISAELAQAQHTLNERQDELDRLEDGTGNNTMTAINQLERQISALTFDQLRELAQGTQTPEDDELVGDITHLGRPGTSGLIAQTMQALEQVEAQLSVARKRRENLEEMESQIRSRSMVSSRSRFRSGTQVEEAIDRVSSGHMDVSQALAIIVAQHYLKPLPPPPPVYRSSSSSSSGSFGGGGFSSGGGFGGGGFSTGGGF